MNFKGLLLQEAECSFEKFVNIALPAVSQLRRPQVLYWLPHISVLSFTIYLKIHKISRLSINARVHSIHSIISQAYFNIRHTAWVFLHTKMNSGSEHFCVDTQNWTFYLQFCVCRHTGSYARTHTPTNTRVSNFPCLGSIINDDNSLSVDKTHRIKKWIRACCVCKWLMASKLFNNYTKRKLHVTLVRPAVNYMHETWTLSLGDTNNLRVFGRQIVSKILWRIECKKGWRIKSNKELKKLMKGQDIVKYMKVQRKNVGNFSTEWKIQN